MFIVAESQLLELTNVISRKIPRRKVRQAVCVILRVPSLFIIEAIMRAGHRHAWFSYLALTLAVILATLPLKQLVSFYVYLLSSLFLLGAHFLSRTFVASEQHEMELGPVTELEQRASLQRLFLHLVAQCFLAALITYLIEIKTWTKYAMLVNAAPVMAHLLGVSTFDLPVIHYFSTVFTIFFYIMFMFSNLCFMLKFVWRWIHDVLYVFRVNDWFLVFEVFWYNFMLSTQLLLFWLILFSTQLYIYLRSEIQLVPEAWITLLLFSSIGDCCTTPISLLAFCFVISYTSNLILRLTKLYLQGWGTVFPDDDDDGDNDDDDDDDEDMLGCAEGVIMILLSVKTGLLHLRPSRRAFCISIQLFIVATSLIDSMYEITDPVLLTLGASPNTSYVKHIKAVTLCTFLWTFPLYMSYIIVHYLGLGVWVLAIASSCLQTSVQVMGSLVVYALFMYAAVRKEPWERLDDVVYCVRSVTRVLGFIQAFYIFGYILVVCLCEEFSWMNWIALVVQFYDKVWPTLASVLGNLVERFCSMTPNMTPHAVPLY